MSSRPGLFSAFFRCLWFIAVLLTLLTGLAHLPLGWHESGLASLPTLRPLLYGPTLFHYWAASLLLLLFSYGGVIWCVLGRPRFRLTFFGYSRLVLLALLCLSGMALMAHNHLSLSLYGAAYTMVKALHLFCALCFLPLTCLRVLRHGKWFCRRGADDERRPRVSGMQITPRRKPGVR